VPAFAFGRRLVQAFSPPEPHTTFSQHLLNNIMGGLDSAILVLSFAKIAAQSSQLFYEILNGGPRFLIPLPSRPTPISLAANPCP